MGGSDLTPGTSVGWGWRQGWVILSWKDCFCLHVALKLVSQGHQTEVRVEAVLTSDEPGCMLLGVKRVTWAHVCHSSP